MRENTRNKRHKTQYHPLSKLPANQSNAIIPKSSTSQNERFGKVPLANNTLKHRKIHKQTNKVNNANKYEFPVLIDGFGKEKPIYI